MSLSLGKKPFLLGPFDRASPYVLTTEVVM
jgi:hypothetical protein